MSETVTHNHPHHNSAHDSGDIMPEGARDYGFSVVELSPDARIARDVEDVFSDKDEVRRVATELVNTGVVTIEDVDNGAPNVFPRVEFSDNELQPFGFTRMLESQMAFKPAELEGDGLAKLLHDRENAALVTSAAEYTERFMDRDFAQFDNRFLNEVTSLSQAFQVESGRGGSFRIFNFTDTPLEDNKLHKLANAVREMDQRTGGTSTEAVQVVGIFPESAERWKHAGDGDEELVGKTVQATASGGGVISLNEALLKREHQEKQGPGNQYSVSEGDIEITMFHEMTHVVEAKLIPSRLPSESFGWELERSDMGWPTDKAPVFRGDVENPSEYGRYNHREDVAESAAAIFSGGEWANALDDPRRIAIEGLFAARHSGNIGPAYLRIKEMPLGDIGSTDKFGMHLVEPVVIRPAFSYVVVNK